MLDIRGRTLLARALDAAAAHRCAIVVSELPADARALLATAQHERRLMVVHNALPERGMSYSLKLANAALRARGAALAVLLLDTPFVDAALLAKVAAARGDADVAYPIRAGRPGHPVVFGPRARAAIALLPDGDTVRGLRDDSRLRRVALEWNGDEPFADLDTPEDYVAARDAR